MAQNAKKTSLIILMDISLLKNLQKSLGFTLATATHSNSSAIQAWKKEVVALGSERIEILNPGRPGVSRPYGFQVMSSLLRHGEYETGFLKNYGTELIGFEHAFRNISLDGLWQSYATRLPLNIDGTNMGKDPMAGYLQALGHNPEAAKSLFYSKEWVNVDAHNPEFEYLLKDREWPQDPVPSENSGRGYTYHELGRALEAATLGVPHDAIGLQRDEKTANVMSQAIFFTSEYQDLAENKPGIMNSLAKMGAAYIDDLNWATAVSGGATGAVDHYTLFRNDGPEHIKVSHLVARRFLTAVSRHPGAYETLAVAQHAYTISVMESFGSDSTMARNAANTGAYNHGILDSARLSVVMDRHGSREKRASTEASKAAEWKKPGIGKTVDITADTMTLPLEIPAGTAAVVIPVPTGVDKATFDTYWGNESSKDLLRKTPELSADIMKATDSYRALSEERSRRSIETYVELHNVSREIADKSYDQIINAYLRAWTDTLPVRH